DLLRDFYSKALSSYHHGLHLLESFQYLPSRTYRDPSSCVWKVGAKPQIRLLRSLWVATTARARAPVDRSSNRGLSGAPHRKLSFSPVRGVAAHHRPSFFYLSVAALPVLFGVGVRLHMRLNFGRQGHLVTP